MSERYTRVFELQKNLYAESAPVVISAGALLKDNQTGKILAQLKFRNLKDKTIKALKISIISFDTVGKQLDDLMIYEYLDLSAERNGEFGQKVPVTLANNSTRSFSATVDEVIFNDNSVWKDSGANNWIPLKKAKRLSEIFQDSEIVKQYKIEHSEKCEYEITEDRDVWICSCGTINKISENECVNCACNLQMLKNVNFEKLRENCDIRLIKEREEAAKRKKNIAKKIIICSVIFIVLVVSISLIHSYNKKVETYNTALELLQSSSDEIMDEGISTLKTLGDFKNSKEELYKKAEELLETSGNNIDMLKRSLNVFTYLDTYSDSKERVYNTAVELLQSSSDEIMDEGISTLKTLGDFKNSKEELYKKAEELLETSSDDISKFERGLNIFIYLGTYNDSKEKVYNVAENEFKNENYNRAYVAFYMLNDYKDSDDKEKNAFMYYLLLKCDITQYNAFNNTDEFSEWLNAKKISAEEAQNILVGKTWIDRSSSSSNDNIITFNDDGTIITQRGSKIATWSVAGNNFGKTVNYYSHQPVYVYFLKISDEVLICYYTENEQNIIWDIYMLQGSEWSDRYLKEHEYSQEYDHLIEKSK